MQIYCIQYIRFVIFSHKAVQKILAILQPSSDYTKYLETSYDRPSVPYVAFFQVFSPVNINSSADTAVISLF